ncbi:CAP domain-containing protein [Pendulispora albinea]|uniref:CAP domain-containing protein n=1 Tax=Pendulispora albinea TaxID=2741071 RepID=A0ABZ2LQ26_9BACT
MMSPFACERPSEGDNSSEESPAQEARDAEADAPPVDLDEARRYNLAKVNAYRAEGGLAPLALDGALNTFAQAASEQLAIDHVPHLYFKINVYGCGCGLAAENQGSPHGWRVRDVHVQIDQILEAMMQSPGHRANMMNPAYRRMGAGLVRPGADLYFTNDFGR